MAKKAPAVVTPQDSKDINYSRMGPLPPPHPGKYDDHYYHDPLDGRSCILKDIYEYTENAGCTQQVLTTILHAASSRIPWTDLYDYLRTNQSMKEGNDKKNQNPSS